MKATKRTKKVKKGNANKKRAEPKWFRAWLTNNVELLRTLQSGFIAVHPKYGMIMHDHVADHVNGKFSFLKRSIAKKCTYANVTACLFIIENESKRISPLACLEGSMKECKESEHDEQRMTLVRFAQKHALKAADVLIKMLELGKAEYNMNTMLTHDDMTELEKQFSLQNSSLPEEARTSPHKQPPYKPWISRRSGYDPGIVLDGYSNRFNKTRND